MLKTKAGEYLRGWELLRYLGPGFLVTVGFTDPGNWATNIQGGARFGYSLLWVIVLSTLMLLLLQNLSARIGIVTGRSLAANIRQHFSRPASHFFGFTILSACAATDVATYLGAALGFQILFRIPVVVGALLTLVIVVVAILGQRYERLERLIVVFLTGIAAVYLVELFIVKPDLSAAARGMVIPNVDSGSILIAMAMLGAVVMPHNIYLHSNVIQSREWAGDPARRRKLMRFGFVDTSLAMAMGWAVNSAMIIVAAAVFFRHREVVTTIEQASATLRPLAGPAASILFGVALLISGVGSSITSSLSQANVFTGFLGRSEDTHSNSYRAGLVITSIPAVVLIGMNINSYKLLILSQVALSLQLPFTIIPLLLLARNRRLMGEFASKGSEWVLGILVAVVVIGLNVLLLYRTFGGTFKVW
jgi:manganese transport protein